MRPALLVRNNPHVEFLSREAQATSNLYASGAGDIRETVTPIEPDGSSISPSTGVVANLTAIGQAYSDGKMDLGTALSMANGQIGGIGNVGRDSASGLANAGIGLVESGVNVLGGGTTPGDLGALNFPRFGYTGRTGSLGPDIAMLGSLAFGGRGSASATTRPTAPRPVLSAVADSHAAFKSSFVGPLKTGFSAEELAYYRASTPNQQIRSMVNPVGPKIDPIYGYPVTRLEADHLVSYKEIMSMPRMTQLPPASIKEVLNLPENFVGLGKSSNASKGAQSYVDWPGHSKLGPIDPEVRNKMLLREAEARAVLQREINQRLVDGR